LDWRLKAAALVSGFVFASSPVFLPNITADHTAFVTAANTIISLMQYVLVTGLILTVVGILWKGPIGHRSARRLLITSIGLGVLMILSIVDFQFLIMVQLDEDCCRDLIPAVAPAQNLLWVGLLIPTTTFCSHLVWIVWDNNRKAKLALTI
jgi:hypothetical protein